MFGQALRRIVYPALPKSFLFTSYHLTYRKSTTSVQLSNFLFSSVFAVSTHEQDRLSVCRSCDYFHCAIRANSCSLNWFVPFLSPHQPSICRGGIPLAEKTRRYLCTLQYTTLVFLIIPYYSTRIYYFLHFFVFTMRLSPGFDCQNYSDYCPYSYSGAPWFLLFLPNIFQIAAPAALACLF